MQSGTPQFEQRKNCRASNRGSRESGPRIGSASSDVEVVGGLLVAELLWLADCGRSPLPRVSTMWKQLSIGGPVTVTPETKPCCTP